MRRLFRCAAAAPFALAVALAGVAAAGCGRRPEPDASATAPRKPPPPVELKREDVTLGTGTEAKEGDKVAVQYTGALTNGEVFDSSVERDEPFEFTLGQGEVIKGWDEGVVGMKVGGKRKLTIPYQKAYGDAGSPPKIPPRATLLFDIELVSVNGKT